MKAQGERERGTAEAFLELQKSPDVTRYNITYSKPLKHVHGNQREEEKKKKRRRYRNSRCVVRAAFK